LRFSCLLPALRRGGTTPQSVGVAKAQSYLNYKQLKFGWYVIRLLILSFLFMESGFGSLDRMEFVGSKKRLFSVQEACLSLGKFRQTIIDVDDYNQLDCTGQKLDLMGFCGDKVENRQNFARGFYHRGMKKIICQEAEQVTLVYGCSKFELEQCESAEKICLKLKDRVALRPRLLKFSTSNTLAGKAKKVTCLYQARADAGINQKTESLIPSIF